jgi:pantoate--beta-alanine ligase
VRAGGRGISLVVTQGNLHEGQASLVRAAVGSGDFVVMSVVANPLEFGPSELFHQYPSDLAADLVVAEAAGAHAVFHPESELLHPAGHATYVEETNASRRLCGISRPVHFRGFLTNFLKLLQVSGATRVWFGHKDLQQAAVARQAIRDLFLDVAVEVCPTVREEDGLVLNWRNRSFTPTQRAEAAILPKALEAARQLVAQGVRNIDRIVAEATHVLTSKRMIRVVYVQCVDPETVEPVREVTPGHTVLVFAVWVGETRLLDNCVL